MSLVRYPASLRTKGPRRACVRAGAPSLVSAVVALLCAAAAPARGEEPGPTPQAVAYGYDWVEHLRADELAADRSVICIVDTGVAITPDTPADDPAGPIVLRTTVSKAQGDPAPLPGDDHGTYMAIAAVGARNGWGTVGVHPQGRLVSVRATVDETGRMAPGDFRRAITRCQAAASTARLAAVSLSLSSTAQPTPDERKLFEEQVAASASDGTAVFAAAGNDPIARTSFPADVSGVVAVTGGDPGGHACASSTFDSRVALLGPGCGVTEPSLDHGASHQSDSGGASMATAVAAAAASVLTDLDPEMTGVDAARRLIASRHDLALRLDRAAWRAAHPPTSEELGRSEAQPPTDSPAATDPPRSIGPRPLTRVPLRARWRAGRLIADIACDSGMVILRVYRRSLEFRHVIVRRVRTTRRRVVLRVSRPSKVTVSAVGRAGAICRGTVRHLR